MTAEERTRFAFLKNRINEKLNELALLPPDLFEQSRAQFEKESPFDTEITRMVVSLANQRREKKGEEN